MINLYTRRSGRQREIFPKKKTYQKKPGGLDERGREEGERSQGRRRNHKRRCEHFLFMSTTHDKIRAKRRRMIPRGHGAAKRCNDIFEDNYDATTTSKKYANEVFPPKRLRLAFKRKASDDLEAGGQEIRLHRFNDLSAHGLHCRFYDLLRTCKGPLSCL
jgi:hypothetical protein